MQQLDASLLGHDMPATFPARPSLAGNERRPRTSWVVRRRYKQARWVAAGIGMLVAAYAVYLAVSTLDAEHLALSESFDLTAVGLVLAGMLGPWLLVEAAWRRSRRRNFWNWQ